MARGRKYLRAQKHRMRKRRVSLKYPDIDIILIYRLYESPPKENPESDVTQSVFSLTVTKISCRDEEKESVSLHDIARNEKDALYIFDKLSRCTVTPCTAAEIVSDLIGIPRQ